MKHTIQSLSIRYILTILFIASTFVSVYPQMPQVRIPQPSTMTPGVQIGFPQKRQSNIPGNSINDVQSRQQAEIMREVEVNERRRRQETRQTAIREYLRTHSIPLPDFTNAPGAEHFHTARKEIIDMLEGREKPCLKRAVFLTENAFFDNTMSYEQFDATIQQLKNLCLLKLEEDGLSLQDDMAKKMMIFQVMTDEINVKEPGTEKMITHYPMKYDFDDYQAEHDKRKYMISKLLAENSGQCHSLPLLFLILAEELDTEAYISYSPQHSFVKFKDDKGKWYDAELTQGAIVTDDFYMGSGFIKADAIRNGLFLEPRNIRQSIAHTLNDLSSYYVYRVGMDDFVRQNADTVLHYVPNDLNAYMILSNFHTDRAMYVLRACEVPSLESLPKYPQAQALYNKMIESYAVLDSLGYEEMPSDVYQDWLNRVNVEKEKPGNQPSFVKQIKK